MSGEEETFDQMVDRVSHIVLNRLVCGEMRSIRSMVWQVCAEAHRRGFDEGVKAREERAK